MYCRILSTAFIAFIAIVSASAWAGEGSSPETPFELGVLRGAAATTLTLTALSDVSRWGAPITDAQRADVEGFRRSNPYTQISYAHWGYVRAVKLYLETLSVHLRSAAQRLVPDNHETSDDILISHRTVSPEVKALLHRYADGLGILGRPHLLIQPRSGAGSDYAVGHEVFAATLRNRGSHWSVRLTEEMGSQAGMFAWMAGFFMKKSLNGAVAGALMGAMIKQFGTRAIIDHDAGLIFSGRALIDAAQVVTDPKPIRAAFLDVRQCRKEPAIEAGITEDEDGIIFFPEEGVDPVMTHPDFIAFQNGYALGMSHVAATVLTTVSTHVVERLSTKERFNGRAAFEREWNEAALPLKKAASCSVLLSPVMEPQLAVTR